MRKRIRCFHTWPVVGYYNSIQQSYQVPLTVRKGVRFQFGSGFLVHFHWLPICRFLFSLFFHFLFFVCKKEQRIHMRVFHNEYRIIFVQSTLHFAHFGWEEIAINILKILKDMQVTNEKQT